MRGFRRSSLFQDCAAAKAGSTCAETTCALLKLQILFHNPGTDVWSCRFATMGEDKKEMHARILKYIGEALRADMWELTDGPPPSPILLQVLHLIRREQQRRGLSATAVAWEELPDDLQRLLEQLKIGQGPGRRDV